MITILRIEANNFRSLGHAVVEPLTDGGLTALNGPNGSGKSSMLSAVLFALYAVTPDGVAIKALRRQGSTDPVKVVVTFTHDGQTVTVERGLKGVKDSHYAHITVDGIEQVFGKVAAATSWVQDRLGLDKEGFLTAFAVRQKELDGLVRAKPAERRALIERLAGIDRMSTAVQTARAEENDAKRRLDVLPGSGEDVAAARTALDDAQTAAVTTWEAAEVAREHRESAQERWDTVRADAATLKARLDEHASAAAEVTTLTQTRQVQAERAAAAVGALTRLTADADGGSEQALSAAREQVQAARAAVDANRDARERARAATTEVGKEQQRVTRVAEREQRLRREVTTAQQALTAAQSVLADIPADLPAQHDAAQTALDAAVTALAALRAEHARLDASIKALHASTDPTCPTCATALPDPSTLLASLTESLTRVQRDGAAAAEVERAARERVTALTTAGERARRAHSDVEHATAEHARTVAAHAEVADEHAAATQAWDALRATVETAQRAADEALSAQSQVEADLAAAEDVLRKAQIAADAASRLPQARAEADAARAAVDETSEAIEAARAHADTLAVPEDEVTIAREAYRAAQEGVHSTAMDVERAEADYRVAAERVIAAERHRDGEEAKVKARLAARNEYERKVAVRTALDTFRKERIAAIAPELSEAATDLIPRLTDGKFVAVTLDEEFTPVITDHLGQQRPVAWLSGGEESAVALALRLALGEIIAGTQGGLLWMDEPQTAMDAERRPAMMTTIRSIPGRQPIIISHVSEATDMVDLVFDVIPDPENGSTIAVAGQGNTGLIDEEITAA